MTSVEFPSPIVLPAFSPSRKVFSVLLNDGVNRENVLAPRVDRCTNAVAALLE
jgi:hypothetical protein